MIKVIGSAFGHGAQITETNQGPQHIKEKHPIVAHNIQWAAMLATNPADYVVNEDGRNFDAVFAHNTKLAASVSRIVENQEFPLVVGGDHSSAIGTWSGTISSLKAQEEFGLIWMDAHMDSHTLETSPSKAFHGMPLAILMGHGKQELCRIGSPQKKVNPKHLVLIGTRSYEEGEENLLNELGVRVFHMEEIRRVGVDAVVSEALKIVKNGTQGFGISIDMDAFDPSEAPGVGSPEAGGLKFDETLPALKKVFSDEHLKAMEITELNPERDSDEKTSILVQKIMEAVVEVRD